MNFGHLRIAIDRGPNSCAGIRQDQANPPLFPRRLSWFGAGSSPPKYKGSAGQLRPLGFAFAGIVIGNRGRPGH